VDWDYFVRMEGEPVSFGENYRNTYHEKIYYRPKQLEILVFGISAKMTVN
jgi:hypothetical protein